MLLFSRDLPHLILGSLIDYNYCNYDDDDDKNDDGEDRVVIMIGVEQELVGRRGNLGETSNSVEVYFLPFQFLFNP